MNTHVMNRNARDTRIAETRHQSRSARDEHDEQFYLEHIKNYGTPPISTCAPCVCTECAKKRVHRVHRVTFITGGGFRSNSYLFLSCASRADFDPTSPCALSGVSHD